MTVLQEIEMLDKAVATAKKLLADNAECRDLFGVLGDPSALLDNLENRTPIGWLEVSFGRLGESTWASEYPMSY